MPQLGFVLSHEQFPAPQLIELGIAAEAAGFDAVWTSDHFHPWMDNQGHSGQAWITLAALGQRTRRITMGTGVTCPTYRYNPAIVAQAFASLAVLYPQRIFLGLGSGEALNEVPPGGGWGDFKERSARLGEAVEVIRQLWAGEWVDYDGQYYQLKQAHLYDLPTQPIPLYIAAGGKKSGAMAGRLADGLISDATAASSETLQQAFAEGAQSVGKDPRGLQVLAETYVVVGDAADAAAAATRWRFSPKAWTDFVGNPDPRAIQQQAEAEVAIDDVTSDWIISPDPAVHAAALQRIFAAGVTQAYIHSGQSDQQRVIDFYGREVIPRLQRAVSLGA